MEAKYTNTEIDNLYIVNVVCADVDRGGSL